MTDENKDDMNSSSGTGTAELVQRVVLGLLVVAALFSIYQTSQLNQRIESMEAKQVAADQDLARMIKQSESRLAETSEELSQQVGQTQKQLESRAAELSRQQKVSESRLKEEQAKTQQALSSVAGEVQGVKGEVGGVKTDVVATKTDLEETKARLERTIGDLGIQSGLIATTREELEFLKQKGDKNYFEFTLNEGKPAVPVSTISLQLKKVDQKRSKYTMNVMSDDRTIEKKDKNLNEPVQFYTGKDRMLYELVVFSVTKDRVTGYLATPKRAPAPINR